MLKVFAGFLHLHLEPGEIAGRLGGDEFAALLRRDGNTVSFLNALSASLDHYNDTSGKPYSINYSFDEVMYLKKKRKTLSQKTEP